MRKLPKKARSKSGRLSIDTIDEPHVSNRRGVPLNKAYPAKAIEWYYPKNCGFGPEDFSYGSKIVAWWKCPIGHIYDMSILDRTLNDENCPFCLSRRVCKDNSLQGLFPKIAKQWHPEMNGELKPKDVFAQSNRKAWWLCPHGHSWKANINSRTGSGSGCPVCHDKRCLNLRNYPKLFKLFDRKKNPGLNIERLTETTEVWWRCDKGPDHSWCMTFKRRGDTLRCPYCSFRLPSVTNTLNKLYPELAKELHPTRNGKLKAKDIPSRKNYKVWWRCSKNSRHVWQSTVANRTINGSGCPKCWVEKRAGGYFKELAAERMKQAKKKKST